MTAHLTADDSNFRQGIRRAKKDLSDLSGPVGKGMLALAAVGPALGGVAGALSAVGAGVASIAGAAGPAVGVLAAYPVVLGAAAQAAGVAKFALEGIPEAAEKIGKAAGDPKKMKAALQGLTPAAVQMAKALAATTPVIDRLRASAQAGLFPGLSSALSTAVAVAPKFRDELRLTGTAMGGLADDAALLAVDRLPLIQRVMRGNVPIMSEGGHAALALGDALLQVVAAAQPMTAQLVRAAGGAAEYIRNAAEAGRTSGELAAFFQRAYETASQLATIARDLGVGLFNALSIGARSGRDLLDTLEGGAAQFRAWTESASGIRQIAAWFAEGQQNLSAMGRLVRSVTAAMSGLGSGSILAPLLDQIGTQLVPVLGQLIAGFQSSGALPGIVDALTNLAAALVKVTQSGSGVTAFVATLGAFSQGILWITQNVPGASTALGALFMVLGAAKAASLLGLLGPIQALGGALLALGAQALVSSATYIAAMLGITTANTSTAASSALFLARVAAQTAVLVVQTAVTWLATAATTAFGVALAVVTSPITLVIVAIVALVAAVVILYKKNETFRDIVTAAWSAVQAAISAVVNWITGTAMPAVKAAWNAVSSGAQALAGLVASAWNAVRAAVTAGVNAVRAVVAAVWGAIGPLISGYVNAWRAVISTAWAAIQAVVSGAVAAVKVYISGLAAVAGIVGAAFGAARAAAAAALSALVGVVRGVVGQIVGAFSGLVGVLTGIGANIVQGLANGIRAGVGAVISAAQSLANAIPGPLRKILGISSPSKVTRKIGEYVIAGLIQGLERGKTSVRDTVAKLAKLLRDNLSGKAESGALAALKREAKGLRAAGSAYDKAVTLVEKARDRLSDAIKARDDYGSGLTSSLRDAVSAINALDAATEDAPASVASVTSYLQSQLRSLQGFAANLQSLTSRGLSHDLISQIADAGLGRGSQLAGLLAAADQQSLATLNSLQGQINSVTSGIGANTAQTLFGGEIGKLREDLGEQLLVQRASKERLDHLAEETGDAVVRALRAGGVRVQVTV